MIGLVLMFWFVLCVRGGAQNKIGQESRTTKKYAMATVSCYQEQQTQSVNEATGKLHGKLHKGLKGAPIPIDILPIAY